MSFHKHFKLRDKHLILSTSKRPKFFFYKNFGSFHIFDFWIVRVLWN